MRMLNAPDRRQVLLSGLALALAPRSGWAEDARPTKIGILNDMSSAYADSQGVGSVVAAQLAVDDFSAKLGVPIEIVSADHQNKPDAGAAIARRWIDTENVDVIMDLPNSAVALAVLAVCEEKNKAAIGSGAGSSVMTGPKCSRNFVHWTYDTYAWGVGLGKAVTEAGGKNGSSSPPIMRSAKTSKPIAAPRSKQRAARCRLGSPSDQRAGLLLVHPAGAKFGRRHRGFRQWRRRPNNCFKQAHEFGLADKQKLVGLTLNVQNVPALGLDTVAGALMCTAFYWDENDGTRAFAKRFQAAHPKQMMPNDMHAGMYAATEHLIKAIARSKAPRTASSSSTK